ncbi:hypothetical protein [Shewanella ulleungensis]|uniref:Uncharacterized protein n=1 Tax=Shewanella ulleungensis TaxID=2282699 RepID=A0ABQ2QI82_9GAMM|nr:hypothetical protein [Shewanella ulleungensis]MCL1149632.1 hypothetical protein [Shewanella ulleungensis]GGP80378.1 hypothetical protein GCM10009410_11360 [Shewanella ulleungensis]
MTFPWARILLMLLIVGLGSLFLINSRVLIMSTAQLSTPQFNTVLLSDCVVTPSLNLANCDLPTVVNQVNVVDSFNADITANNVVINPRLIDIKTTLLGYVGVDSVNPDINSQPTPNDIHYVPTYSARYINLAQHQSDEVNPNYLLAYEFVSPPVPSLEIGYQINFSPQLDWVLSATSGPSRISAWKESNLLFVYAHTC